MPTPTSYLAYANRWIKRGKTANLYPMIGVAAAIAEALETLKGASWVESPYSPIGSFPDHFGTATEKDEFDAFAASMDINSTTGAQNALLGAVAYRVTLPAAAYAGGVKIVSVGVTINGDPYLLSGARVAVALSSTATPSTDWTVITSGDANAAGVSPRTQALVNGSYRWYPGASNNTIVLNASGVQSTHYIWIYLSMENYTTAARMPWVEGGAAMQPVITLTFADAIGGLTAGTNIAPRSVPADITASRYGTLIGNINRYVFLADASGYNPLTPYPDRMAACIGRFHLANAALTDISGVGVVAGAILSGSRAVGAKYGFDALIFGGILPVAVSIPARQTVKRIVITAPPSYTGLQFQVSAYYVDGCPTDANAPTVPHTDPLFWRGELATTTIGGLSATLLGTVRLTTAPVGTFAIPVKWPGYLVAKYGQIYLVFMPLEPSMTDTNWHGIGNVTFATPPVPIAWLPAAVTLSPSAS
jgi:hypothetical protein